MAFARLWNEKFASTPYRPQQNGVTESANRTIMDMANYLGRKQWPMRFTHKANVQPRVLDSITFEEVWSTFAKYTKCLFLGYLKGAKGLV